MEEEAMDTGNDETEDNELSNEVLFVHAEVLFVYTGKPEEEIPIDTTRLSIADSVQNILGQACRGYCDLISVSIPKTVQVICEYAFAECAMLAEVILHQGLKVIERSAFENCTSLVDIDLPGGLEQIGEDCFSYCASLLNASIPTTVEKIEDGTYFGCTSLANVSLHNGIKRIEENAFCNCQSLYTFDIPHGMTRLEKRTFSDCRLLREVSIPKTVSWIGRRTFHGCVSLVKIQFHEGLRRIGSEAFANCHSLNGRIAFPSTLEEIEDRCFAACKSLSEVSMSPTMTSIGESAFSDCVSLVEVHFHEGLKCIGDDAFRNCSSLSAPIAFPSTLEEIGLRAFWGCVSLLGFEIPADTIEMEIGEACFKSCESLVTYSISDYSVKDAANNHILGGLQLLKLDGTNRKTACRDRWTNFPIHELCYHSSRTTVEGLAATIDSCESLEAVLEDAKNMTPFHIVATSPYPRVEIVQCLLDRYPLTVLEHKDKRSKTMLDYLLMNGSSHVVPIVQAVLQSAFVDRVSGWSPVWDERYNLGKYVRLIRSDHDIKERRKEVFQVLEHVGHCIRKEMTSLIELSLWEMKTDVAIMEDSVNDTSYRESCRLQCGKDIVVPNVIEYLFSSEESTCSTALLAYPLCTARVRVLS